MVEQNDYASCDECGWFYSVESSWSKQTPVCGECDARLISGIKPLPPKKYLPYLFQTQPCDGGATAVVYEGTNLNTRQPVMGKRFSANTISAVGPDELVAQAEASADFGVSGVVSTYDIRESEREVVLVLPKIQGRQLGNIRLNPDFKCEEALDLILPVLQILAALHRLGVLHNDVKPSNAIVGRQGTTLIDLCSTGRVYACPRVYSLTPGFASPQLALRQWDELCPSSDVYSVGKMFL
ncbi:MAG TPA: hypothetical protein PKA58_03650, partial [Polyangium sp.]|nr:hypothetical protein [Polyangium sp.]